MSSLENATPMLRQYLEIKRSYPGTILFFRLGDFYEMFNEDAVVGSRELNITLTARHKDSENPVPMCGVPHHSAASYIAKLVKKGYRVAICEQSEPAAKGVKLVKREVVRVITPGTAIEDQILESRENVFLCAVAANDEGVGASFLDVSTGEFVATQAFGNDSWQQISEQIAKFNVREIVVPAESFHRFQESLGLKNNSDFNEDRSDLLDRSSDGLTWTSVNTEYFSLADGEDLLKRHFKVLDLKGFGISDKVLAVSAAGACLKYALDTQRASAEHVSGIEYFETADHLMIDAVTVSNLEIIRSRNESSKKALVDFIDQTITGMGSRLLKNWLLKPLIKRSEIETRLSAVAELSNLMLREQIRLLLKGVQDIDRLTGKLNLSGTTARDLLSLKTSLDQTPRINQLLSDAKSLLLQVLSENIFEFPEIRNLIEEAIALEPPINLADGGTIKNGFDSELDDLRGIASSVKTSIASFEESERNRTGIATLKIRYNNVFGYYIEVSKANLGKIPDDYERRQTLANAERYTTPQLKEWEAKVLGAEEKIIEIETRIFNQVKETVRSFTPQLQITARALATLDVLAAIAENASKYSYVRPQFHDGDEIEIKSGRHPVVERTIKDSFVPNDIYLNNSTDRMLIITGANMGGKSTILRQTALIQILGQIGSFVPASSARLPLVDRIWTRVGASDDLASGRSTFMVEMTETAAILHSATSKSLVLLDEIGRGTSTFDGMSIAWAVAEYLHDSPQHSAKTIFATHYHELTELAENLPGAVNYQMTASENDDEVVFLHRLIRGKASKSYGIAVAKLAGLPAPVIDRAKEVLGKLEKYELAVFADETDRNTGIAAAAAKGMAAQFSLFDMTNDKALDDIRNIDIESLDATSSKEILRELKNKII